MLTLWFKSLLLTSLLMVAIQSPSPPVYEAASILRGEAPDDCIKCRELTACSLVDDQSKGIDLRSRWYGYRTARDQDVELILRAQNTDMCTAYPKCRFVGNGRDLEVWARKGYLDSTARIIAYCGTNGCSVCVPRIESVRYE